MRTQKLAYLLIFLAIWSQLDDALLTAFPSVPPVALADDDDDYLSVKRERARERASSQQKSVLVRVIPKNPSSSISTRRGSPPGSKPRPFGPFPLYVFMSLQL
jgi:hypothetical protein